MKGPNGSRVRSCGCSGILRVHSPWAFDVHGEFAASVIPMRLLRTAILTTGALVAFATNSLLCRFALGRGMIDPGSFTSVRLLSGTALLLVIVAVTKRGRIAVEGTWASGLFLAVYAATFSYAYISLTAGTGTLILFAGVQCTMILAAVWTGDRSGPLIWVGIAVALSGLVYLVLPDVRAASAAGATLMGCAGIAWALYSLRGRGASDPILETTGNFLRALPFVLIGSAVMSHSSEATWLGALLAATSGAVASGIGYVVWYAALRDLTTVQAAIVQLLVPVLTALGGVLFLSETMSLRLVVASVLILGGIALGFAGQRLFRR